ncbi:MAG: homoserine O-acetyltransferase [Proteobacteria bacterium]|nr:homoserine O-acetyltransferase [Pseudomonadota bacterium]
MIAGTRQLKAVRHVASLVKASGGRIGLPDPFVLRHGGELRAAAVAYETWGRLNARRDNAILLFTGLSPSAHAASNSDDPSPGWWEGMVGAGRALDTDHWFVICVNSLGSCFGSTGPASIDPDTGRPYGITFPELAIEDIAAAGHAVVRALGIAQLDTVIGASLGGMTVLAYVAQFPTAAQRVISISGSAAARPFAIALRSLQREAITSDPDWQDGRYSTERRPINGMRVARKLGTITYRSAAEWQQRFGRAPRLPLKPDGERNDLPRAPFGAGFAVEDYLEAQAQKFSAVFDPNCYLYLSRAMDRFELAAALAPAQISAALVIGVQSDILFTPAEQREIATAFEAIGARTRLQILDSLEGHDAFLVDTEKFAVAIHEFLTDDQRSAATG